MFKIAERNEKEGPESVGSKGKSGRILLIKDKLKQAPWPAVLFDEA